jgi:hypothetical protein
MLTAERTAVIHHLYGIDIRTPWPVAGVPGSPEGRWDVEFIEGDARTLDAAAAHVPPAQAGWWAQYADLPDGSRYRRWTGLFEFLVTPNARRIHARTLNDTGAEALLAYLLVDALSFSMVHLGWEPLHATAVLTAQGAVGFLGDSGLGKSTLAALFIQGGARLLTDDMLVLTEESQGLLAQAGPPRIKLYRAIATRILGDVSHGVPMNAVTEKLIIPLDARQSVREAQPLRALYLLHDDSNVDGRARAPVIRRLSPARAFPQILAGTAAHAGAAPDRLRRQFEFVTRLVRHVPVKTLSYRRNEDELFGVRRAVLDDLAREVR